MLFRGAKADFVAELFRTRRQSTPQLLMSRSEVSGNFQRLQNALPGVTIHYAVKSNNHQMLLDETYRQGGSFDVCSHQELEKVLKTGISPQEVIHSHPIKSLAEFDAAVARGVEVFVVDNPDEVRKLSRYTDRKLKIMIRFRINTNSIAVVNLQYKFGCSMEQVVPLAQMIRETGHEYFGLCFHIGSQCIFAENYVLAITAASELIAGLRELDLHTRMLDIGGGFPVPYVEPIPDIEEFCTPIRESLRSCIPEDVRVVCEPGRFLSASSTTLVCSVLGKAERDGKMWYYLDDGLYSTFSGIVFDHCQYPVVTNQSGEGLLSVLAGPTCDSFDVMYDGLMIPEHAIGDIMVFPMTGAYCVVSGSDFNSLKRPDCLIVD